MSIETGLYLVTQNLWVQYNYIDLRIELFTVKMNIGSSYWFLFQLYSLIYDHNAIKGGQ